MDAKVWAALEKLRQPDATGAEIVEADTTVRQHIANLEAGIVERDDDVILPLHLYEDINRANFELRRRAESAEALLREALPFVDTNPDLTRPGGDELRAKIVAAFPCPCGEATCTESWEPGCGLGNSVEHARIAPEHGQQWRIKTYENLQIEPFPKGAKR